MATLLQHRAFRGIALGATKPAHQCPPCCVAHSPRHHTISQHRLEPVQHNYGHIQVVPARLRCWAAKTAPGATSTVDLRIASLLLLLKESFQRATGRQLVPVADPLRIPQELDTLHCAVIISEPMTGTGSSTQPQHIITYANEAALQLLLPSTTPGAASSLVGRPLHHIAPDLPASLLQCGRLAPGEAPGHQVLRQCALHQLPHSTPDQVQGQTTHSQTASLTADCLTCDLASPTGKVMGKVLLFDQWTLADGRRGRPFIPAIHANQVPTAQDLAAAQEAIRHQADLVKSVKSRPGATNQDAEVKAAVSVLQERKAAAASVQKLLWAFNTEFQADPESPFNVPLRLNL